LPAESGLFQEAGGIDFFDPTRQFINLSYLFIKCRKAAPALKAPAMVQLALQAAAAVSFFTFPARPAWICSGEYQTI
jgi:hypothetical protein